MASSSEVNANEKKLFDYAVKGGVVSPDEAREGGIGGKSENGMEASVAG